ncbi:MULTISPECIES: hypothetical protein [Butyricimonas]|uniref:hypothetical protein n=1 Tax=Butyricimonas TaxID=574697 RepID=UPI000B36F311|nr:MULTISPECIES: hypothetical protein [Butyricimonas]OUN67132.1 hypothetical protein B5G13_02535 [Butyricimonas sp. An62]
MKLNKLVMVALVALGAVACEKSDKGIDDQSPKSVTINLANVQAGSRSMGDPLEETDKVVLERFQVFFTDGTTLYLGKKADGTAESEHYFESQQGESLDLTPATFHFLPANVSKVIVVGNMDKIDVISGVTKVEVLEEELAIETQQEEQIGALSLYGEKGLTEAQVDGEGHMLYTANVEVAPRIARIEIANFTCNFAEAEADREYKAFTINHVALNNYYTKTILSTAEVQEDDLENTVINSGSVEPFFEGLEDGWNNDKFAAPLELTWDANTKAVGTVDEVLAYNFFPGAKPQIVVRMTGTKNEENAQPAPTFLATLNLKDGNTPIAEFVAGTIYKIDFVFNESDPDQTEKCIDVTVTPVNWSVVTVTPEF